MRLFEPTVASGLEEMKLVPFKNESGMRKLVAGNIDMLFPGLKMVKNEMKMESDRSDTVAFDTRRNTFVILEYKNKKDDKAALQAKGYMNDMQKQREKFVMVHDKSRDVSSYDWKNAYTIIIAPSFEKHAIKGVADDETVELHTIEMYDNHTIVMERVGGAHERPNDMAKTGDGQTKDGVASPPQDGKGLRELKVGSGAKPTYVTFPDHKLLEVKSWITLHTKVFEWLFDNNKISPDKQISTKDGWVLFTTNKTRMKQFHTPRPVKSGWFEGNRSAKNYIRDLIQIIDQTDLHPNNFKISIRTR